MDSNKIQHISTKVYIQSSIIAIANIIMLSIIYTVYSMLNENNNFDLMNAINISTASSMIVFASLSNMHQFMKYYSKRFSIITVISSISLIAVSLIIAFLLNLHIPMLNQFKNYKFLIACVHFINYILDVLKNFMLFISVSVGVHLLLVAFLLYIYKLIRKQFAEIYKNNK